MNKYYVVEIQGSQGGAFAYLVHEAQDNDPDIALQKGESVYYQVLAAAAISTLPVHSAILFDAEGNPKMNKSYKHGS